jgi:hypothetical protein
MKRSRCKCMTAIMLSMVALTSLSDTDETAVLSPLGERAMRIMGRGVRREDTRHVRIYSADPETLKWVGESTDAVFELIDRWFRGDSLGISQSDRDRLILFIIEEHAWSKIVKKLSLRDDGLAMQFGRELYVQKSKSRGELIARIAHEIAHERAQRYFPNLPVWLEEGLAGMVGWDAASAVRKARGWTLTRPPLTEGEGAVCSVENVVQWSVEYPPNVPGGMPFERCAEAFARALERNLGYGNLIEFMGAMGRLRQTWDVILRDQFGFNDEDFRRLESAMRETAVASEK